MHDRNSHLRVCSLSREVEGNGCRVVVEEWSTEHSVLRREALKNLPLVLRFSKRIFEMKVVRHLFESYAHSKSANY